MGYNNFDVCSVVPNVDWSGNVVRVMGNIVQFLPSSFWQGSLAALVKATSV